MDLIGFIRDQVKANPARFIAYGAGLILTGSLQLAAALGITIPGDVQAAVAVVATFVVTEAIRFFVYSPATVDAIITEDATHDHDAVAAPDDAAPEIEVPVEPDPNDGIGGAV